MSKTNKDINNDNDNTTLLKIALKYMQVTCSMCKDEYEDCKLTCTVHKDRTAIEKLTDMSWKELNKQYK